LIQIREKQYLYSGFKFTPPIEKSTKKATMQLMIEKSKALYCFFVILLLLPILASCPNPFLKDLLAGSEVTFNTNGGSPVPAKQYVWKGDKVEFPSFPFKFGFIFAGWYLDNFTFNFPWNFSIIPSGDMILHAKWNPIDFDIIGDGCTHDWGNWTVTTPASVHSNLINTCNNGVETRRCLNCNRPQTRSIPCLGTQGLVINGEIVGNNQSLNVANVCIPNYRNGLPVTSTVQDAFLNNSTLTRVRIGRNVTSIGAGAFSNCSFLTSVTFAPGSELNLIGLNAFQGCTILTNITIPAGVTSIGDGAFSNCSNLTNITIPASVTHIGENVFTGTNLTTVTLLGTTPPGLGHNAFLLTNDNLRIFVPAGSAAAYRAATPNWNVNGVRNRIHRVGCNLPNATGNAYCSCQ
jgi:uncharacterized repeat protein (TIGR02543 family)